VRFSSGDAGRAVHALAEIGELIESERFSLPVAPTFPLAEIAEAHRVSEDGHVRGKLVLVVGSPIWNQEPARLLPANGPSAVIVSPPLDTMQRSCRRPRSRLSPGRAPGPERLSGRVPAAPSRPGLHPRRNGPARPRGADPHRRRRLTAGCPDRAPWSGHPGRGCGCGVATHPPWPDTDPTTALRGSAAVATGLSPLLLCRWSPCYSSDASECVGSGTPAGQGTRPRPAHPIGPTRLLRCAPPTGQHRSDELVRRRSSPLTVHPGPTPLYAHQPNERMQKKGKRHDQRRA